MVFYDASMSLIRCDLVTFAGPLAAGTIAQTPPDPTPSMFTPPHAEGNDQQRPGVPVWSFFDQEYRIKHVDARIASVRFDDGSTYASTIDPAYNCPQQ